METFRNKEFDLKTFKQYVESYKESDAPFGAETFIKDMIYGIGIVINPEYVYAKGYKDFVNLLKGEL